MVFQWRRYVPFNNAGTAVLFPTSPLALIIRYSCSTDTDTTSYRAVSRAPGVPGNFTGTIPEIGTFQPTLHGDGDPSPHFNMSTQPVFLLISADGVMSLLYWLTVSGTTRYKLRTHAFTYCRVSYIRYHDKHKRHVAVCRRWRYARTLSGSTSAPFDRKQTLSSAASGRGDYMGPCESRARVEGCNMSQQYRHLIQL